MKILQVDTLRLGEFPNILFVEIHTDEGIVGLGETFMGTKAIEAYVHETAAPYLLGKDPLEIERHASALSGYLGYGGTGAEMRGKSAIDIALWDILGQAAGKPLYQILGGSSRDAIPIYNTCAGYRYIRERPEQKVDNWGLGTDAGPYEDLDGFLHRADELALSLLEQGIAGMKIWPFDPYAEASGGAYISTRDLDEGLEPFRKIRSAVGSAVNIMVEFHGLWNVSTVKRIVSALEEFEPFWFEDPVRADDLDGLAELARSTHVPLAVGESLAGSRSFREMLQRRAVSVVIVDPSWAGGISEAKKISAVAESFNLPVTFHDCTGPVVLAVGTHLSIHVRNAMIQETVRAFYSSWYYDLVTELPPIADGTIYSLSGPGLGTALRPEVREREDAMVVTSSLDQGVPAVSVLPA